MAEKKNYWLPEPQLRELLSRLSIDIIADTSTDLIAFCPFHHNRDSPAFNISKRHNHLWRCHNGKCAKAGNLITLLMLKGFSKSEAEKLVLHGGMEIDDLVGLIADLLSEKPSEEDEWNNFNYKRFRKQDESSGWVARDYFAKRGINSESYDYFGLGYAANKGLVVIPIFDQYGQLCGTIGREWRTKRYEYSAGLGRRNTIWNIHNAKLFDSIILCEGALDAIYVHQAGFPNVGAVLGSAISPNQWKLIRKYFTEVICFFDNDDAGQALTEVVMDNIRDIAVSTVDYGGWSVEIDDLGPQGEVLARPAKDPGELSVDAIQEMIEHRLTSVDWILNKP